VEPPSKTIISSELYPCCTILSNVFERN